MEQELRATFTRFSTFGNRVVHTDEVLMDSRACQKLCKDAGLTGKKLTSTDIDLLFATVKPKGDRKINFDCFLMFLQLAAVKLERSNAELAVQIAAATPSVNTKVQKPSVSSPAPHTTTTSTRLHPDWYAVENPNSTSEADRFYYVNRLSNETSWKMPLLSPTQEQAVPPPPPPPTSPVSYKPSEPRLEKSQLYPSVGRPPALKERIPSDKELVRSAGRRRASLRNLEVSVPQEPKSIFDKLTDPTLYTGAHKHRFDQKTGKGLGLAGRDKAAKGHGAVPSTPKSSFKGNTNTGTNEQVHSISQVLRSW